jgi:Putative adhesin
MKAVRLFALAPVLALTAVAALAESDWQKSYPVSAKPSLTVSTGDASTEVRSCGCREIRIRVEWNDRRADEYTVTEFQSGDHVNFDLKEKQRFGFHIGGPHREPHVTVETPGELDLEARTSDGGLKVYGVNGSIALHTSDGSVEVSDVSGAVRLVASDGSIRIHNVSGTLESKSSDGHVSIDGKLTGLQVHTSDGALELTLAEGSQLTTSSRVEASDGSVKIRLPRTLAADVEIHTGDGHIDCQLPLTMNGYTSGGGHDIRGRLNAGGTPLTIHTGDGNVTIAAL